MRTQEKKNENSGEFDDAYQNLDSGQFEVNNLMDMTKRHKSKINLNGKHEKDESVRKRKIISSLLSPLQTNIQSLDHPIASAPI